MTEARTWLPAGADTGKAEAALADLIGGWSEHWFEVGPTSVGMLHRMRDAGRDLRNVEWHHAEGASLGVGAGGTVACGARAMGVAAAIGDRSSADLDLLRALGEECLADLRRRVLALLGLAAGTSWSAAAQSPDSDAMVYRVTMTGGNEPVALAIALSTSRWEKLVLSRLPPPPASPPLASGMAALAHAELHLSAMLGACELTLAEVEAMAPGDVLVFDSDVSDTLALAIEYLPAAKGGCVVTQQGDRLALQFTQAFG